MNETTTSIVDGLMLLGFAIDDGVMYTRIDGKIPIQKVYRFAKPVCTRRSIDSEDNDLLTLEPRSEVYPRIREWYTEYGLSVPEDVRLADDTIEMLLECNARLDTDPVEIQVPPLDIASAERLREAFADKGLLVEGGVGRAPITIVEGDVFQFHTDYMDDEVEHASDMIVDDDEKCDSQESE